MFKEIYEWLELQDSRCDCIMAGAPFDERPDEVPEVLKTVLAKYAASKLRT